jgi:tetratricopeptide (TPR) repeat protein
MPDKLLNLKTYSIKRPLGNVKLIKLKVEEKKKENLDVKIASIKRNHKIKFKGRDNEISILSQAYHLQKKNLSQYNNQIISSSNNESLIEPTIIGIKGEAGIGKSRLVSEFLKSNSKTNLIGFSDKSLQNPYSLFVSMINSYCQILITDSAEEIKRKLKFALSELSNFEKNRADKKNLKNTYNILGHILGVIPKEYKKDNRLKLPAGELKVHICLSIKYFLEAVAAKGNFSSEPLILLFEDVHWIDDSSLNTLTYLFNTLNIEKNNPTKNRSMIFLLLYRPDFKMVREVELKSRFTEIELEPLDYDAIRDILVSENKNKRNKSKPETIPDETILLLTERSDGNPLYIQEWLKMYNDKNNYEELSKDKRKNSIFDNEKVDIPESISLLIHKRLERLKERELKILQYASVLGNEFSDLLLLRITEMLSNESDMETVLLSLIQNNFIKKSERIFGREKYFEFHHDVIRKIIYESISEENKRILHKTVGEAIENLFKDKIEHYYYVLCDHFEKGEAQNKLIEYLDKAGDFAKENFENERAILFYYKLVKLHVEKNPISHAKIILKQLQIYKIIGKWKEALDICRKHVKQLYYKKDSELFYNFNFNIADIYFHQSVYGNSIKQLLKLLKYPDYKKDNDKYLQILGLLCLNYYESGNPNKAETYAKLFSTASMISSDKLNSAKKNEYFGLIERSKGNYQTSIFYFKKSSSLYAQSKDMINSAILNNRIGINYLHMSEYSKALNYFEKCKIQTEKIGDVREYLNAIGNISVVYNAIGKSDKAFRLCKKKLEFSKRINYTEGIATTLASIGNYYYNEKYFDDALANYSEALTHFEQIKRKTSIANMNCNIALIHMHRGNYRDALNHLEIQMKINQNIKNKEGLYFGHINLANLYKKIHQSSEAIRNYKHAIKIAKEMNSNLFIAIANYNYAEHLFNIGELEKAKTNIDFAMAIENIDLYKKEVSLFKILNQIIKFNLMVKNSHFDSINKSLDLKSKNLELIIHETEQLLNDSINDEGKAKIHFELWKMNRKLGIENMKVKKHKLLALKIFKQIYKKTLDIEYQTLISELS